MDHSERALLEAGTGPHSLKSLIPAHFGRPGVVLWAVLAWVTCHSGNRHICEGVFKVKVMA